MSVIITMEGFDEVVRKLDRWPDEVAREIKKTMRKGSKPYLDELRSKLPVPSWNDELTIKAKVSEVKKTGEIRLSAGVFGKKYLDGGEIPAYYKFLWANYGTLQGRDPNHIFKTKVRDTKGRKNNVGQKAQNYFERATQGAEQAIAEEVVEVINEEMSRLDKELKTIV